MKHVRNWRGLGTDLQLTIVSPDSNGALTALDAVMGLFRSVEEEFSRFREDSALSILNRFRSADVSSRFIDLLRLSMEMHVRTNGTFNPLVDVASLGYSSSFDSGKFVPIQRKDEDRDEDEHRTTRSTSPSGSSGTTASTGTSTTALTQKQVCTTVYDTITNASGTKQQVPRQSCALVDVPAQSNTVAQPVLAALAQNYALSPNPVPPVPVRLPAQSVQSVSGTFRGTGSYVFPGGSIPYSVALTFSSGTITFVDLASFTPSGNGLFSKADALAKLSRLVGKKIGDPTVSIDAMSGASGTSKALNDAIGNAVVSASQSVALVSDTALTAPPSQSGSVLSGSGLSVSAPISAADFKPIQYVAPNGKKYVIHRVQSGSTGYPKYLFERADGTFSTKTFSSLNSVTDAIDLVNSYDFVSSHVTPNGKSYSILRAAKGGKYRFERPDGTRSTVDFDTQASLSAFLDSNNPAPVVAKKPIAKKVVAKKAVAKKLTAAVVTPAKKPLPAAAPSSTYAAPAKTAAPAAVATKAPAPTPAPVAKPDTMTRAS